jgi:hypothetical protein
VRQHRTAQHIQRITLCLFWHCSNRAAVHLALEMWDEALRDAERARALSEAAMKRMQRAAGGLYCKSFAQKGAALIGEGSDHSVDHPSMCT